MFAIGPKSDSRVGGRGIQTDYEAEACLEREKSGQKGNRFDLVETRRSGNSTPDANGPALDILAPFIKSWIRVCSRNFEALDSAVECAELLLAARHDGAARLIYDLVFIRQGFGPRMRRTQAAVAARTGLWPTEDGFGLALADDAASPPALERARHELQDLLDIDLAGMPIADVTSLSEPEDSGAKTTADNPMDVISTLCGALRHHLQHALDRDRRALTVVLSRIDRMVRDYPAYDLDEMDVPVPVHAMRLAFNILKHFMETHRSLAFGPVGGAGIIHALAQLPDGGLGPYACNIETWCPQARDFIAFMNAVAAGKSGLAADIDRWTILLAGQLRNQTRCDLIDEFGDMRRLSLLRALLAQTTAGTQRPDRTALERIRDAGLDLEALPLAWDAQRCLARWWPDDPSQWLVLGDIAALDCRVADAEASFQEALRLRPDDNHASRCLQALANGNRQAFHNRGGFGTPDDRKLLRRARQAQNERDVLVPCVPLEDLAIELLPAPPGASLPTPHDGFHIRRLGIHRQQSRWGYLAALRGVESIRGFFVGTVPIVDMRISLNGRMIHQAVPKAAPLADGHRSKAIFNAWVDFTALPYGCYHFSLTMIDANLVRHEHRERVLITPALTEDDYPSSDTVVSTQPEHDDLEAFINGRPSMVRSASRTVYSHPNSILVARADQLGDLVCALPALQRLRSMFPQARITGLVTDANADLAHTFTVFDEVIVISFPDDPLERRRTMPLSRQQALYRELQGRSFDLAIDLADIGPARPLLRLSGAPLLYGARRNDFPFLSFSFDGSAVDPVNGSENVPAVNKMLGLMEWLDVLGRDIRNIERRHDLSRDRLNRFGIGDADRFALLHAGAQLAFSRWPHYGELAQLILSHTDLLVVLICDDGEITAALPSGLICQPRFVLIGDRLPFDDLDALVSYAALFVGNDSGPKHLAALRGAPVISLHCARNNWNEWGQSNGGIVISRRVPCAGCQINRDPEECGKDFACLTNIRPLEVMEASLDLLRRE